MKNRNFLFDKLGLAADDNPYTNFPTTDKIFHPIALIGGILGFLVVGFIFYLHFRHHNLKMLEASAALHQFPLLKLHHRMTLHRPLNI